MTAPLRPVPAGIARWVSLVRWLRGADALVGWGVLWGAAQALLPNAPPRVTALVAVAGVLVMAGVPVVRRRVRPVSGLIGLHVSRSLQPGAAAWFIHRGGAERVLVTGRRGLRLVISPIGADGPAEGIEVRRTRVLVL